MCIQRSMTSVVLAAALVALGCSQATLHAPPTAAASKEPSRTAVEGPIPIKPVPLFARVSGPHDSSEILVLLAGGPGAPGESVLSFESIAPAHIRVVSYDQRGVGRSPAPPGTPLGYAEHIADLEELRTRLGARRMHLLGHSWGGGLALLYAGTHPDHVASLTLVANVLYIPAAMEAMVEYRNARFEQLIREGIMKMPGSSSPVDCNDGLHAILPAYFADPRFPIPKELAEAKLSCDVFAEVSNTTVNLDTTSQLASLQIPTLVLMGDGDPLGLDMARATVAALPASRAELVVLPRCGHFPWMECPAPLFDAVRPFLARVAGSPP